VTIAAERFYLTANQRDDGSLGEVFIHWGKHGTSGAGLVNTYAIALSMGLAHRVPLAELLRPGLDQHFMPNGPTDDPEIPTVWSAVDYIARRLAIDWLPYSDRAALGVYTLAERARHTVGAALGLRDSGIRSQAYGAAGHSNQCGYLPPVEGQEDQVRLSGHRRRPGPAARRSSPRAPRGASR
jgi:ribonucleoside-diphosphate reductase alpha chain